MVSSACTECHTSKVKCVKDNGSTICQRCKRIGLKCEQHVSRQGQGTRRRKKVKKETTQQNKDTTVDEALAITSALSSTRPVPFCPTSGGSNIMSNGNGNGNGSSSSCKVLETLNNQPMGSKNEGLCNGIDSLEIEDGLIYKTINQGLDKDHYGIHHLIRHWVALSFSRRSFSLLARASFIAAKMGISMDEIISNKSSFAVASDSQPMEFLARDILLSKNQRKTFGFPLDIQEVSWDVLEAVQINPQTFRNRWCVIRSISEGISRFLVSPLFSRDFASVDEINQCWAENKPGKEVIDLFMPKSEKGKLSQDIFNNMFLHNRPNMPCFVTKTRYNVLKRNSTQVTLVNLIMTIKLTDLDTCIHYFEIQFLDNDNNNNRYKSIASNVNKREIDDVTAGPTNEKYECDPIMGDDIEFTDVVVTEEMQEFFQLLAGEQRVQDPNNIF